MANIQALLKISAMAKRSFSSVRPPVPEMIDQEVTIEQLKHSNFGFKKPISITEEKVSQEMEKLRISFLNEMFDALKEDPEPSLKGKKCISRPFTFRTTDGKVISGENVYLVDKDDVHGTGERKLLRTEAFEVDENGNKIKPYGGEFMFFDQSGFI